MRARAGDGHYGRTELPVRFGKETAFEGELSCSRSIAIAGSFTGSIRTQGSIAIERGASLTAGRIKAARIMVAGSLDCPAITADFLELRLKSRSNAEIWTRMLLCEPGAAISGKLHMSHTASGSGEIPEDKAASGTEQSS